MLQKKQSSRHNLSGLKKTDKKKKRQDEGDEREDKPKDRGSGGKSGSKKPKKEDKNKGQTPVHTDKKKALEEIAPWLVEVRFVRVSVHAVAWTTTLGSSAENQSWLHPPKAKCQNL